jgi:hypothetical protein
MERRERRNFEGMQVEHVVTIPCVLGKKPRRALFLDWLKAAKTAA